MRERGTRSLAPIFPGDAGEVLTLQRAAFVQEALIYGTADMPPLTQTLESLRAELDDNLGLIARDGERVVGAVRARRDGDLLLIGRLAVAPDMQGAGIGGDLLEAVEDRGRAHGCRVSELFTGSLSIANLELYRSHGYVESERVPGDQGIEEIYLRKRLIDPASDRDAPTETGHAA